MRKKNKLVCGVGVNDYEEPVIVNGRKLDSYGCWYAMLRRCYSVKQQIIQPTYIDCSVCEEWLLFSNFKKFYDKNHREGFELDKDILFSGNKHYSPETCCFVPVYLNLLLLDRGRFRGDLPLGVSAKKPNSKIGKITTTYMARCSDGYGKSLTKTFKTLEEAQAWYSATKKRVVAEQVQRALDEGAIDQRIADALLSREF